jgi:cell division septation protein DedD
VTNGKAKEPRRRIAWGRYLLFFFVAAWMFFLGVMVGRGTAPVRFDIQALQEELADLRDTVMREERAAMETALRGEDEKAVLGFYEALEKDGPDTTESISMGRDDSDAPTPRNPSAEAATVPHKARAAIMAKKNRGAGGPDARSVPSQGSQHASAPGNLTIQVVSLKDADAAQQTVAKLIKGGYAAYLSKKDSADNDVWYRVRVGPYENRQQATADMDRLTKLQLKPIIVRAEP